MPSKVDDRPPLDDQRNVVGVRIRYTGFPQLLPCAKCEAFSLV